MLNQSQIELLKSKNISVNTESLDLQEENYEVTSYDHFLKYTKLLNVQQSFQLVDRFRNHGTPLYPVGIQGLSDITNEEQVGSKRKTVHDQALADFLTKRLLTILPKTIKLSNTSPMDWQSDNDLLLNTWELESVSPVFRYMEYSEGGRHNPHYDSEYKDPDNLLRRTLLSGVLYLTDNSVYTRVIDDKQDKVSFKDRDLSDWDQSYDSEANNLILVFPSQAGYVSVFPHRVCHDVSENYEKDLRIIIRFDIFCKAFEK